MTLLPTGVSIAHPERIYLGGQWVPAHSGRLIELVSPDTEHVVARVAEADEADMDAAVAAARAAFDHGPWSHTPLRIDNSYYKARNGDACPIIS